MVTASSALAFTATSALSFPRDSERGLSRSPPATPSIAIISQSIARSATRTESVKEGASHHIQRLRIKQEWGAAVQCLRIVTLQRAAEDRACLSATTH